MPLIGLQTPISTRSTRVDLDGPGGPPVPDGDGGFIVTPAALSPPYVYAKIKPATAYDLERLAAGTILATATLLITMPFHPGVTTQTRLTWIDDAARTRTANVVGVVNVEDRCHELVVGAVEVVA